MIESNRRQHETRVRQRVDEFNESPSPSCRIILRSATADGTAHSQGTHDGGDCQSPCPELLYLFLGRLIQSNVPGCWKWLTMHELANLKCVSREIRQHLVEVDYPYCSDGNDYVLPYPGIPGVLTKGGGLFPHQLASLRAMYMAENRNQLYGALRGGILGDAPGLGKTITLLSLVASTAGQRVVAPSEFWDETSTQFTQAWANARVNEATAQSISKVTKYLRRWAKHNLHPSSRDAETVTELLQYIQPPYRDTRFPTVHSLERYIRNKMKRIVPPIVLEQLRQGFVEFRAGLDKRSRRLFASPQGRYLRWERSLIQSCATLIVVPDALLEHWFQQIYMHMDLKVFAPKSVAGDRIGGVVYLDGFGDMAEVVQDDASLRHVDMKRTIAPTWELSQYLIVVTTFSRCRLQLKTEVAAGRTEQSSSKRSLDAVASDSMTTSPFLQIRWLRLVVDEGHELGEHPTSSDITRFVHQIAAERRWVLSGTPMTGDEDDKAYTAKALDQLQRLLFFLRHPIYGRLNDDKNRAASSEWELQVKKPFLAKEQSGKAALLSVLKSVMVMHRKEDIDLPSPVFEYVEQEVNVPTEIETSLLKFRSSGQSLVGAFDNYLHSSDFQSLVDQAQADYIADRLMRCRQEIVDKGCRSIEDRKQRVVDRRPIKAVVYSSEHNVLLSVTEFLLRTIGNHHVAELYESEKIGDMNAELSRFRHGIKECKICPICRREETNFAFMNSGTGCSNQLLEVVSNDGLYRRFLIEPERICETLNVESTRLGGEPLSQYSKSQKFWRVGDQLTVDIRDPHPLLAERKSEQTWHDDFGSQKCKDLALKDGFAGADWYFGALPEDTDGSGRLEVTLRKWQTCARYHNARWYAGPRISGEPITKVQEDVFLLALDASLSHGLDLSFVTHIFLLEPIDDAALLEQITSRAHRIGAIAPVTIVTVHAHYQVSSTFEQALSAGSRLTKRMEDNKVSLLQTVICEHCYRSFGERSVAEEHERTNCPRNPMNLHLSHPFHLSTVYREIRPPPALQIEAGIHQT